MAEIVFILEPDTGRVTVESSQADAKIAKEIYKNLGQGSVVNCARPKLEFEKSVIEKIFCESPISKICSRLLPGLFRDPQWIALNFILSP